MRKKCTGKLTMKKRKMKVEDIETLSISSDDDDDLPLKVKPCRSDDDDDDETPLNMIASGVKDAGSSNLYEKCWLKCEFCDLMLHNRYNLLVHTAKHIIIPLIKQELFQCSECMFHFETPLELRVHAFRKHSNTIPKDNQSLVKCESSLQNNHTTPPPQTQIKLNNLLESFVKREPMVKCDDLGLSSLNSTGLKTRIIFEEELDQNDDNLLNNFTNDCKVNIEVFKPFHRIEENVNSEPKFHSVHYDDLMKAGKYVCRNCMMSYPNSYELVIHETEHMRMKGRKRRLPPLCPVCERYISGNYRNLNQHIQTKHTHTPIRKHTTHTCVKCGLKYINYYRHIENYHLIYKCKRCGKGFEDDDERNKHTQECQSLDWDNMNEGKWDSRMLKICDICYSFTKNKQNAQYVDMGDFSEMGKRHACYRCGYKYFELKLVRAWHMLRAPKEKRKVNNNSCQERLLKRLKMLRKKYLFCCFIFIFVIPQVKK